VAPGEDLNESVGYLLLLPQPLLNYEAERLGVSCNVERVKAALPRANYVIMMRKGFPYRKIFDHL